eukprot:TRINITY_DN7860_c0_g3_i2.p1 TRINITY_DN7860_c0_g3~~TRINITY_DN7860_c0_g3_i2.p1  ORF type:complete len:164 (+),score=26.48 TRINITY_DN7860_c0_g3_i2:163-654(+)
MEFFAVGFDLCVLGWMTVATAQLVYQQFTNITTQQTALIRRHLARTTTSPSASFASSASSVSSASSASASSPVLGESRERIRPPRSDGVVSPLIEAMAVDVAYQAKSLSWSEYVQNWKSFWGPTRWWCPLLPCDRQDDTHTRYMQDFLQLYQPDVMFQKNQLQ